MTLLRYEPSYRIPYCISTRVSSVELSVVFSVEKMSVEKNMTLNLTINNTKFFKKQCFSPIITSFDVPCFDFC